MSDTVRERIVSAFAAAMAEIPGVTVERNRDVAIQAFPCLVVVDSGQAANDDNAGFTRYTMSIDVEGYVSAGTSNIGTKINELYGRAVVRALFDRTLGGLALDVSEVEMDVLINREDGQARTGAFRVTFAVDYFTTQGNPYILGPA